MSTNNVWFGAKIKYFVEPFSVPAAPYLNVNDGVDYNLNWLIRVSKLYNSLTAYSVAAAW